MTFYSAWLLPLFFMFHDFEELVLVPNWLQAHDPHICGRTLFGGVARSDVLAVGIWEEFNLFILIAVASIYLNLPVLTVAAAIPYLFHLIMHVVFTIVRHGYVPGVVTSVIELPFVIIYMMGNIALVNLSLWQWGFVVVCAFVVFIGNLGGVHWGMNKMAQLS